MSNEFSKEERVAFESMLEGFNDALVLSNNVSIYRTEGQSMERASDTIWRPMPYIAQSYSGTDATSNFNDVTQLSVPATLGYQRHSPWIMTATELRDALQEGRLGDAAKQKLASDINVAVMDVAAQQGTLVVKQTAAATGFTDIALCDTLMNSQGVNSFDRYIALSSHDYNLMAANLASRTLMDKSSTAYERAYVGTIASFETYKLDYANRNAAAAGGGALTTDTQTASANYHVPKATSTAATGEVSNVDNRYQTITLSATTSVVAGDAFTIAGVYAVHHITKRSTGALKTFRVIQVVDGTTLKISPAMITAQGASDAEKQYQNCTVTTESATSAIVFLNTHAAPINPFWQKDAIELLPGRYAVPANAGAAVMRGTTDQGLDLVLQKQYDINTMKTKFRLDTFFGVAMKQPEMAGILLCSQS